MKKRLLAVLLACCMAAGMANAVFAADELPATAESATPLRRAMARRMLSRGVMLKAGSFLLLRSSIVAVVSIRVFEQVVQ